jgi:Tfp pilus assembly protein PilN
VVTVDLIPSPRRALRKRRLRTRLWTAGLSGYVAVLAALLGGTAAAWETDNRTPAAQLSHVEMENDLRRRDSSRLTASIIERQRELAASRSVEHQPDWSILMGLLARAMGPDAALRTAQLSQEVVEAKAPVSAAAAAPTEAAGGAADPKAGAEPAPPARAFTLRLTGVARSQGAVSGVVQSLEASGVFSRVELQEARREAGAGADAIAFNIFCRLGRAER